MNYIEFHLGDYAAATAHLSWDEDMAYMRLLRAYYSSEAPIPADLKQACRLARATTPAQRTAVETVLQEYFDLRADGWHQKRCDAEIERATDKKEKAKRSAAARWDANRSHSECNANASSEMNGKQGSTQSVPRKESVSHKSATNEQTGGGVDKSLISLGIDDANAMRTHSECNAPNPNPYPNPKEEPSGSSKNSPPGKPASVLRSTDLVADGVDPQAAADWLTLRKAKRLPLTPTAWRDTKAEADRAGLTPGQAVATAVSNNWAGFKAAWLDQHSQRSSRPVSITKEQRDAEAMRMLGFIGANEAPELVIEG